MLYGPGSTGTSVIVNSGLLDDAGLASLRSVPKLRSLSLETTALTDAKMRYLQG